MSQQSVEGDVHEEREEEAKGEDDEPDATSFPDIATKFDSKKCICKRFNSPWNSHCSDCKAALLMF